MQSANAADMLSSEQVMEQIIGHTITGLDFSDKTTVYTETYESHKKGKPKGKLTGLWGEAKEEYPGSWKVKKDGKICFTYPGSPSSNGCYYLSVSGDQVQFYKKRDGEPTGDTATIVE
jgi:hypothetical protein